MYRLSDHLHQFDKSTVDPHLSGLSGLSGNQDTWLGQNWNIYIGGDWLNPNLELSELIVSRQFILEQKCPDKWVARWKCWFM